MKDNNKDGASRVNRQMLLRISGTILALVLLVVLVYQNGWQEISGAIKNIPLANLLLAGACIILSRLFIMARWYVLLRSAGVKIRFVDVIYLVFTGLFANNFLPTTIGGDVVRLAGAMQMGYDRAVCLASIAADRVVNMIGMCLAAPLGLWQLAPVGALHSIAAAGLIQKGLNFLKRTLESFSLWIKQPMVLLLALVFALLNMVFSFSANYILIKGLGGTLPLWKVLGLFSLSYFVSLIPISINGYGVQELSVTFLLSQVGGVSVPISATVAVIHRLLMVLASLPGALTLPGVMAKMDRSQDDVHPGSGEARKE